MVDSKKSERSQQNQWQHLRSSESEATSSALMYGLKIENYDGSFFMQLIFAKFNPVWKIPSAKYFSFLDGTNQDDPSF